jgi:hypothetical protein
MGFSNTEEKNSEGSQTAISITHAVTRLETAGSNATTLAEGTVVGQWKIIRDDTEGGTTEMTVAEAWGSVDSDSAEDGDTNMLMWTGTAGAALSPVRLNAEMDGIEIATD